MLEVIAPGESVELEGGIHGKIAAVMIEDGPRISYKVMWPNGNVIAQEWIPSFMLKRTEPKKLTLGFGGQR